MPSIPVPTLKSIPVPNLKSIPVPNLKSINSNIPKLKNRSCDFFGRITCNLFQSHAPPSNEPQSRNVLERRTVDSTQISTISSLVDTSQVRGDNQKENFGLYALKHSRSSASKRGSFQSQNSASRATVETRNHEHFQPCRAASIESASSQQSVVPDEGGYYEIDLSDDSDSEAIKMSRLRIVKQKSIEQNVESVVESNRPKATPPVPPKRVKSKLRPQKPKPQQQKLFVAPEASPRQFVERSLQSQRNKLTTGKRFKQIGIVKKTDIQSVEEPVSGVEQSRNEKIINRDTPSRQFNVSKNKSELYRINGLKSIANAKNEKYPQPSPSVLPIEGKRRTLHRYSPSLGQNVDIFKSTNQTDAFEDFDKVLQIAPVVAVHARQETCAPINRYSDSLGNECADENRNQNRPKRSNRVTIKNRELGRRSKVIRDSNANTEHEYNKNWKISADSNEITIYSHDKLHGELDEEIIV